MMRKEGGGREEVMKMNGDNFEVRREGETEQKGPKWQRGKEGLMNTNDQRSQYNAMNIDNVTRAPLTALQLALLVSQLILR